MPLSTDISANKRVRFDAPGILTALAAGCLAATVLLGLTQVVLRYVFNAPLTWSEEAGRYLFVWSVFLGMAIAYGRGEHVKVTTLVDLLPAAARRGFQRFAAAMDVAAIAVLLHSGVLVAWGHRGAQSYSMSAVPQVVFYLAVPVGALAALYLIARRLRRRGDAR